MGVSIGVIYLLNALIKYGCNLLLIVECGHPDIYEIVKVNDMRYHLKKNGKIVFVADCMIIVNHWKGQYNIDK